jgi:hypothetical protein
VALSRFEGMGCHYQAPQVLAPTYRVRMLCGYRSVVYVFICSVRFAEASRQVVKTGSKIIEVVWTRNNIVPPCRDRGHHNSTHHKARPI